MKWLDRLYFICKYLRQIGGLGLCKRECFSLLLMLRFQVALKTQIEISVVDLVF